MTLFARVFLIGWKNARCLGITWNEICFFYSNGSGLCSWDGENTGEFLCHIHRIMQDVEPPNQGAAFSLWAVVERAVLNARLTLQLQECNNNVGQYCLVWFFNIPVVHIQKDRILYHMIYIYVYIYTCIHIYLDISLGVTCILEFFFHSEELQLNDQRTLGLFSSGFGSTCCWASWTFSEWTSGEILEHVFFFSPWWVEVNVMFLFHFLELKVLLSWKLKWYDVFRLYFRMFMQFNVIKIYPYTDVGIKDVRNTPTGICIKCSTHLLQVLYWPCLFDTWLYFLPPWKGTKLSLWPNRIKGWVMVLFAWPSYVDPDWRTFIHT